VRSAAHTVRKVEFKPGISFASREGRFNKDTAKDQHRKAFKEYGVKTLRAILFAPYRERSPCRIRLRCLYAEASAEHCSITITQRYCHPQAEAVEQAFAKVSDGHNFRYSGEQAEKKSLEIGNRTPRCTQIGRLRNWLNVPVPATRAW
jgi:hypothetical protein